MEVWLLSSIPKDPGGVSNGADNFVLEILCFFAIFIFEKNDVVKVFSVFDFSFHLILIIVTQFYIASDTKISLVSVYFFVCLGCKLLLKQLILLGMFRY